MGTSPDPCGPAQLLPLLDQLAPQPLPVVVS
jgi:hypothetical protein